MVVAEHGQSLEHEEQKEDDRHTIFPTLVGKPGEDRHPTAKQQRYQGRAPKDVRKSHRIEEEQQEEHCREAEH